MAYLAYEKGDSVILIRKPSQTIIELRIEAKHCREHGYQEDAITNDEIADFLDSLEVGKTLSVVDPNNEESPTCVGIYNDKDIAAYIDTSDIVLSNYHTWFK